MKGRMGRPKARRFERQEPTRTRRHLPITRGECPDERPCPFVSCRYHLALELTNGGNIVERSPGELEDPKDPSCALDVAEEGEVSEERIAELLGVSHQRVNAIMKSALAKLAQSEALREFA